MADIVVKNKQEQEVTLRDVNELTAKNPNGGTEVFIQPSGSQSITSNGSYDITTKASVNVNVPNPSTGKLNISDTSVKDVTNYAQAQIVDPNLIADNIKKNVTVLGIPGAYEGSGGGGSVASGVKFLDWNGSIVESWESSDVASKTELPNNPTRTDYTSQGWNWSLANIKSYIAKYPNAVVNVGQTYAYANPPEKTEFYITLTKETGLNITCNMYGEKDWGDGTVDNTTSHTYADYGDYVIKSAGTFISTYAINNNASNNEGYCLTKVNIGDNVTSISAYAFYQTSLTSITIPNSVTSIGNYAFFKCPSLTNITIPNSVTSISNGVFSECPSLTSVTLPNNITSIYNNTFSNCYNIDNITIPGSVTSIGNSAFNKCYSLTNITIPDGVTSISEYAFGECCSLTNVILPNNITNINNNAFYKCYSLTNITIPDGVTSIGNNVFNSCCRLTNITIPNSVISIGYSVFYQCYSLANITIPDSVTSIGSSAFSECCCLTNVTISDGVTSIDDSVFYHCYSLANIKLPDNVTSIGSNTFYGCRRLEKYDFTSATAVPALVNTNAFTNINQICKILVPAALYEDWIVADKWSTYADYIYPV